MVKNVLIVLVVDVPDELLQDDYSCENMEDVASFIEVCEFRKEWIIATYQKPIQHVLRSYGCKLFA